MSRGMRAGRCEAWPEQERASEPDRCSQSQRTRKRTESNARERADGEWCTLEMNKAALLPRETWELCLGRGPLFCLLLLRTVRVQMIKTCVLLAAVGRKAAQPWKARPVIE